MAWCEANRVDYLFGLARNSRLIAGIEQELAAAPRRATRPAGRHGGSRILPGKPARAGAAPGASSPRPKGQRAKTNPRFIVTSLARAQARPAISTKGSTAPAARWRTGSRSASSTCSPTAPRPGRCAPTSSGSGSHRWPTSSSRACAASALDLYRFCAGHLSHYATLASNARGLMPPRYEWRLRVL